jgi:exodeoxyribonuclease VIII
MTEKEYNAIEAVNKSTLWEMRKSPLHYWHLVHDTPKTDTAAMKFGRAAHSRILTPEMFKKDYTVAPEVDRRTKEGKRIWAELEGSEWEVISSADCETIEGMAKELERTLKELGLWETFSGAVKETPIVWIDGETGVKCKGRLDAISGGTVIDYKTTSNASPDSFTKEALRYGYDLQAAMYLEGSGADSFVFIAQEKTFPYAVNVIRAGEAFLDRGRWMMRDLLTRWKECNEKGIWPGYNEKGVNELIIPEWEVIGDE